MPDARRRGAVAPHQVASAPSRAVRMHCTVQCRSRVRSRCRAPSQAQRGRCRVPAGTRCATPLPASTASRRARGQTDCGSTAHDGAGWYCSRLLRQVFPKRRRGWFRAAGSARRHHSYWRRRVNARQAARWSRSPRFRTICVVGRYLYLPPGRNEKLVPVRNVSCRAHWAMSAFMPLIVRSLPAGRMPDTSPLSP